MLIPSNCSDIYSPSFNQIVLPLNNGWTKFLTDCSYIYQLKQLNPHNQSPTFKVLKVIRHHGGSFQFLLFQNFLNFDSSLSNFYFSLFNLTNYSLNHRNIYFIPLQISYNHFYATFLTFSRIWSTSLFATSTFA